MDSVRRFIISSFIFISILGYISFFTGISYAGIGVSPENIEMMAAGGSETKGSYAVVNDADTPIHVKVDAEDWLKMRMGKTSIPVEQWLKIDPMEFDIGPKESTKVDYVITPPQGQEGELAAMVYFGTTSKEGAFNITSRFGVSIYVAIENTIKLGCKIGNIMVARDKKIDFGIEVENSGNVHIRPTGNIEITGENGETYNIPVQRGFPVYAGKKFVYSIPWDKTDVAPGKYNVNVSLDCGSIYKIDKRIEKKTSFIVKEDGTISF